MYNLHFPVLNKEVYQIISNIKEKLLIIDCTYGAGGHSELFLKCGHNVIAFDRDINTSTSHNIPLIHDKFSNLEKYVKYIKEEDEYSIYLENNFLYKVDKIMIFADLGMSTMQLKNERGFSFMSNSLLDMRMSNNGDQLYTRLEYMPQEEIERIIREYGEEKRSRIISENIHKYRARKKITTTFDLREAIGCDKFDVLARVFQAFRIYINDELVEVYKLLQTHADYFLIISFHSLEDKIVKKFGKKQEIYLPTKEEILVNAPSRSAKMRFWKTF